VLNLLTGAFSLSVSLFQVDMLGCVAIDVAPTCSTGLGGICTWHLSLGFPCWDGSPGTVGFFEVVLPGVGL
jgi:hypothetical protein